MLTSNPKFAYKTFKKIKAPSSLYLADDTKRSCLQLQVDLMNDFGNIVRLPHFSPCFAITHPDYVKHIFLTNQSNYIKSDKNYEGLTDIIGAGIITNNGEPWHEQRLNLAPLFQPHQLPHYFPNMISLTQEVAARWQQFAKQKTSFNLTTEMMSLTLKISARNFLNEELDEAFIKQVIAFSQSMNNYVGKAFYFFKFLPFPTNIRLRRQKKIVDKTLLGWIQKRRALPEPPADLLTQLLQMRNKKNEPLSDTQILAELKNFLVASYETVSHTLTWTWLNLIKNPACLEKVRHEIQTVHNSNPDHSHPEEGAARCPVSFPHLPYTKMVIEESMRLHPPAWVITRRALRGDELEGYFIPAGSYLVISPYAIHRHPAYWHDPEKFIPERFTEENKKSINRYSYLPFGAGPRTCIASHLAIAEAQTILAGLIPSFDLTLLPKQTLRPLALITLSIKDGLWVTATTRSQ
ncbi:MAG: cytochrome P450 [Gammaproteobacteria bacterium]|nr:cytochrome P450 [Gammaproteobacteria bacterium]